MGRSKRRPTRPCSAGAPAALRLNSDLAKQPVFGALIQPILQRRCVACHGPEKKKADLSLESYKAMLKGGKDGPVLIASKAFDSPMIQRLLLPMNDEDHMPPEGKPQPTLAEIDRKSTRLNSS